jgi:hypothetical protein
VGHLLGRGHVEEIVFTGALERLRVRMPTEDPVPAIPGCVDCTTSVLLEVTRTQAEQRAFPLRTGQGVAIAARRIHVLPTPLSSFTVFATGEGDAAALSRHAWLNTLATQMQTRIAARIETGLGAPEPGPASDSIVGVSVIATGPGCARQVDWLLANQAEEILCLSGRARAPARVVIYCATPAARRATLAVAASLLRHVPAEAVYVQILPAGEAAGPSATAVRELLDVRSEAKDAHGLDVRTELRFGAGRRAAGRTRARRVRHADPRHRPRVRPDPGPCGAAGSAHGLAGTAGLRLPAQWQRTAAGASPASSPASA